MKVILENTGNIVALLALFGITFEVAPVKINPISWLGKLVNKDINDKLNSIQNDFNGKIKNIQKQINDIEYKNAMKDLADIRIRIIKAGMEIQKGEQFDCDYIKSLQHDLDMYDYYKDTYVYMEVNGRKVKINGEVETARELINEQAKKCRTKEGKK